MLRRFWWMVLLCGLGVLSGCSCERCFVAGTLVETPEGPRAIETLQPGDTVISVDVATGARVPRQLQAVGTGVGLDFHTLTLAGHTTHAITATHPVLDHQRGEFVPVSTLEAGNVVMGPNGEAVQVTQRSRAFLLPQTVYHLQVQGPFHTFIADGVVVHNKELNSLSGDLHDEALCTCAARQISTAPCDATINADGGTVPCCVFSMEELPERFTCTNSGVRDITGLNRVGANIFELGGNLITDLSPLYETSRVPTMMDFSNNPISDIHTFALQWTHLCRAAQAGVTIDLRMTQLAEDDRADVGLLVDAGCPVLTSLP